MSNSQKKALKLQRLARVAAGRAKSNIAKKKVVNKKAMGIATPKMIRTHKCGCKYGYSANALAWERIITCPNHEYLERKAVKDATEVTEKISSATASEILENNKKETKV